nr:cytochrome c [Aureimonas sp. SA4125]
MRGKKVMGMCQVCHGKDGVAPLLEAPNLAGQKETYLVKALMDYKTGVRQNEQMTVVASGLEDADIANVAAYYASIPFTVGPLP